LYFKFPKIGRQKHSYLRHRGLHCQGERLWPLKNVLRQRPIQEEVPALRSVEVDGHRVPQGRVFHHEVGRLELRSRPLGDLLPRPGDTLIPELTIPLPCNSLFISGQ